MENQKITKVKAKELFNENQVALLSSRFELLDLETLNNKIETADERLDETNESYVDKFWFGWKKAIKLTFSVNFYDDTYVKFDNDSRVELENNNEYYLFNGNYGIDYLVILNHNQNNTIIYGIDKE